MGARRRRGHFKDPTPGQGSRRTAPGRAIVRGDRARFSNPAQRDAELRKWWLWRDRDAIQHYWFSFDVGRRGPISPVLVEMLRRIASNDETRKDFLDIFLHRHWPRSLFNLRTLVTATGCMLVDPGKREGALSDAFRILRLEFDRRRQGLMPRLTEKSAVDEIHLDHQPSAA
jgi:hypothetical protein